MDKVAGSKNDEYYTPMYAILPIIRYLKPKSKIWCPFDTEKSNYVKKFRELGFDVAYSHISTGDDFFTCEMKDCDYIISNPPYSKKTEVFERLFLMGKPFAMLVGVAGLFESKRRFGINEFEIMYFDKRISYLKSYEDNIPSLHPPFSSVYLCHHILPQTIVFERLQEIGHTLFD